MVRAPSRTSPNPRSSGSISAADPRRPTTLLVGFVQHEIHRHAVDAIALMGGRRAVVEDVPEMTATGRAVSLGAYHAEAAIDRRLSRALHGLVEARPAGAALELALGLEQRRAAAGAGEMAGPLLQKQGAASRRLGAVAAHAVILLGRQEPPPFRVGMRDRIGLGRRRHRFPPLAPDDGAASAEGKGKSLNAGK